VELFPFPFNPFFFSQSPAGDCHHPRPVSHFVFLCCCAVTGIFFSFSRLRGLPFSSILLSNGPPGVLLLLFSFINAFLLSPVTAIYPFLVFGSGIASFSLKRHSSSWASGDYGVFFPSVRMFPSEGSPSPILLFILGLRSPTFPSIPRLRSQFAGGIFFAPITSISFRPTRIQAV